jgi:phosphatidylglycerol---prolipoprotein diacylglyceryl transferase
MPTLAVYLHNLDPYAIKLWEGGPIRWYGLSYLLGFLLGYLLIRRVVRAGRSPFKLPDAADLVVTLAVGVVIGGRVGYVLFYDRELLGFIPRFPWWSVLAINHGGMSFHGGMIGAILASLWFALRRKLSWAHLLDLAAFATPLGLFFGRIANFINGELYGREIADKGSIAMKWAVQYPQEMFDWLRHDPAKLAALHEAFPNPKVPPGYAFTDDSFVKSILQDVQDRNPDVIAEVVKLLPPRHPSQIYEALMEGLCLMVLLSIVWWKPRKPLVVGAWFAIGYGAVRIIGEFFRTPDAIIANEEWAHWGITRGQVLSALLLLAGIILLTAAARRNVPAIGGWRKS